MSTTDNGQDSERGRTRGFLRWARWRLLTLLVVFVAGLVAFQFGVGASERPEVLTGGVLARIYYTLGLFVLGGLDIGIPTGGPDWARALAWFAYFAAPAVTTSALIEAVLRAVRPHALRTGLRDHVIIGGCGRLSMLYMRALRAREPRRQIVVVERHLDNPYIDIAAETYRVKFVHGDLSSTTLLTSLQLHRAHRVLIFTGDDHVNLNTAARMIQLAPNLANKVVAHVADLRLLRVIEGRNLAQGAHKFNSYRTAAHHLVESMLSPHFIATAYHDTVVLAGFGRFGQTVLDELQKTSLGQFNKVLIVDTNAESLVHVFAEQVGFADGYEYECVSANIHEPRTWQIVESLAGANAEELVFILASGNDSLNMRTALWLTDRLNNAMVVARCFHRSEFTSEIARECNFHVVSTAELLLERFDREGLFERSDLSQ
jgi:Trk K+ transport system NAD-binding subunit